MVENVSDRVLVRLPMAYREDTDTARGAAALLLVAGGMLEAAAVEVLLEAA